MKSKGKFGNYGGDIEVGESLYEGIYDTIQLLGSRFPGLDSDLGGRVEASELEDSVAFYDSLSAEPTISDSTYLED